MKGSWARFWALSWLAGAALAANQQAINVFKRPDQVKARVAKKNTERIAVQPEMPEVVTQQSSVWLNSVTQKFAVDGKAIPEVNFDIGESYAGLLPISDKSDETRQLFFWFFPSTNPDSEEITIWLNGGPGCSSLGGLLEEIGPFLWQSGTLSPVPNSYSWSNLTNVLFIEQPVGVGFSQGQPNITNEVELGLQFIGFYKQFVDAFQAHGKKVYITGESYAGFYVPYIADAFITANDTTYYNLAGVGINDPIIGDGTIQTQMVMLPFVEYWSKLYYFNETFMKHLHHRQKRCGFAQYIEKYFTFPPPSKPFPVMADPGEEDDDSACNMFEAIYEAVLDINPCFNLYHITDTCPHLYSQLGIVNAGDYAPPNAEVYFNRTDVQLAINAPIGTHWSLCTDGNVFNHGYIDNYTLGDSSLAPATDGVLQRVVEYTNNALIGVGNLDMILPPNGTLFALQNMTWNGKKGFQSYPQSEPFYVPFHPEYNGGRLSEAGTVGYWGEERGLTFYTVQMSGHELPGYSAGAGYRMLEKLLGRIGNLSEVSDFTTQRANGTGQESVYQGGILAQMPLMG